MTRARGQRATRRNEQRSVCQRVTSHKVMRSRRDAEVVACRIVEPVGRHRSSVAALVRQRRGRDRGLLSRPRAATDSRGSRGTLASCPKGDTRSSVGSCGSSGSVDYAASSACLVDSGSTMRAASGHILVRAGGRATACGRESQPAQRAGTAWAGTPPTVCEKSELDGLKAQLVALGVRDLRNREVLHGEA